MTKTEAATIIREMRDSFDSYGGREHIVQALNKLLRDAGYQTKVNINGKPVVVDSWEELLVEKTR